MEFGKALNKHARNVFKLFFLSMSGVPTMNHIRDDDIQEQAHPKAPLIDIVESDVYAQSPVRVNAPGAVD